MALYLKNQIATLLVALLKKGKETYLKNYIPYILMPDALVWSYKIPGAKNSYALSHYEKDSETGNASWMMLPELEDLKKLSEESDLDVIFNEIPTHPSAIGNDISLTEFERANRNKKNAFAYQGLLSHLMLDNHFITHLRYLTDCKDFEKKGNIYFKDQTYDSNTMQTLISEINEQLFRFRVKELKKSGININQDWFEKEVKSVLFETYPTKMSEITWSYIYIDNKTIIPTPLLEEECFVISKNMVDVIMPIIG